MARVVSRRPLTADYRGQSMWDLWWTKWHWGHFCFRVLRFFPGLGGQKINDLCKISGSHGGEYEVQSLLRYTAV
jgi:hypothetical protein